MSLSTKKRPPAAKDPAVVADELLRQRDENRALRAKMNALEEERRRTRAAQARLEKQLGKKEGGEAGGGGTSGAAAASSSSSTLNPRDAAQVGNLLDEQRRRLEEKDRTIRSLLAGARMQDIGGKKAPAASPAAVYGAGARRPQKKPVVSRPASAVPKSPSRQVSLAGSAAAAGRGDEENQPPDFQPSASRQASRASLAQATPRRSPSPQRSPAAGESKEEDHYSQFNQRLQARLNSSQQFHRQALGVSGDGSASGPDPLGAAPPAGSLDEESPFPEGNANLGPGEMNELVWIRRELRQKKAKIASLQNHFEHLTVSFRVEKDLQKMTLAQCEELKGQIAALQSRERNYQRQLESLEDSRLQLEHQQTIIDDLQSDKRALEERIQHLHTNLFQGDTMEALRHKQLLNEHMSNLTKLTNELEDKERVIKQLKQTNAALLDKSSLGDTLVRDKQNLAQENIALRERVRELMEKLVVFSVDSGVEVEELERALDIVRRQKDDPSRVSFLHGEAGTGGGAGEADPALDTVPGLRRKVSELELKCRDFILKIQQKSDMLNIQYALNKEQKKSAAEAARKIATLQLENERMKYELQHRPTALGDNLSESIFAMSDDGGSEAGGAALAADQLTGLENLIAFRVLGASLNPGAGVWFNDGGGAAGAPPLTFLTADFYEFESSFSEVFSGFQPNYKFTTQYQVDADSFLVSHLEQEDLVVNLYQQLQGTDYKKLATAYIPLRGLLAPTAAIEGKAQLLMSADTMLAAEGTGVRGMLRDGDEIDARQTNRGDAVLGTLHYVLRMKRPILSTPPTPADSRSATPVGGRSRQGSFSAAAGGGHSGAQRQASQYQPSILSSTLSLHHANRDLQSAAPSAQQQQQRSRATMQPQSLQSSPSLRPMQPSQQQQQQQQQQQPQSFSRQPSSRPVPTPAQSGEEWFGAEDFGSGGGGEQQQSRPPTGGGARQPSSSSFQRAESERDREFDRQPSRARPQQQQQQQQRPSRNWDDELDSARDPAPAPAPERQQSRPRAGNQSQQGSRRPSFMRADPEQEEQDIQDLLDHPEKQSALFGNEEMF